MHRHRCYVFTVLAAVTVLALLAASSADAIPAFARKYQFSCSTCHAPVPRLKPFGEEFAARGFVLPPDQEPPRATIDVGDPWLKLMRELPLAVRFDGYASWREELGDGVDFELPWAFKILSGGPIAKNISYYVYGIFEEGHSAKLEDAYVQFSRVFGLPVEVLVGQFQVCDPLFKRELRLEREDYQIFKTRVGMTNTNLAYDRGVVLAWSAPGEVDVIAQIVNGNGIDPVWADSFDDNTYKNTSLRLARQFGPVRLGVFSYLGKVAPLQPSRNNRTTFLGPDLVVDINPNLQFNLQYLQRKDTNPYRGTRPVRDVHTRGGFAELLYFPQGPDGPWALAALYNRVASDDDQADYESASLTLTRLLARNVRVNGELARDLENRSWRLSAGFVTAF
ncbi:MAG: hypothetical protein HRF46_01140 [Acidobacteriota bacterium]|jgi:hypothetical protein